jgi:hypothetical protein
MSKEISVEKLKEHCEVLGGSTKLRKWRYIKEFKNVKDPIDDVVSIYGSRAQNYIEENLEGWYPGIFHLTEVRYKQDYDESLLLFNFRPKKYYQTENPRVLVIYRRTGFDSKDDKSTVEEFYIPFNEMEGQVPEMHYGIGDRVSPVEINEEGTVGFELYHEALGLESELEDLN